MKGIRDQMGTSTKGRGRTYKTITEISFVIRVMTLVVEDGRVYRDGQVSLQVNK